MPHTQPAPNSRKRRTSRTVLTPQPCLMPFPSPDSPTNHPAHRHSRHARPCPCAPVHGHGDGHGPLVAPDAHHAASDAGRGHLAHRLCQGPAAQGREGQREGVWRAGGVPERVCVFGTYQPGCVGCASRGRRATGGRGAGGEAADAFFVPVPASCAIGALDRFTCTTHTMHVPVLAHWPCAGIDPHRGSPRPLVPAAADSHAIRSAAREQARRSSRPASFQSDVLPCSVLHCTVLHHCTTHALSAEDQHQQAGHLAQPDALPRVGATQRAAQLDRPPLRILVALLLQGRRLWVPRGRMRGEACVGKAWAVGEASTSAAAARL